MTRIVPLSDVCDFLDSMRRPVTAKDRVAGDYPYYGANGILDYVDKYLFDEELVLLAEDGGFFDDPKRGVAYRVSGKCWVNNHAHVLRPRINIDVDYLGYFLKQYDIRPYITGATVKKLTQKAARQIKVPLPLLEDQKRIVNILNQAESILQKRKEALKLSDDYLKSVFLEMFGDPVRNPKGWEQIKFKEIVEDICYGSSRKSINESNDRSVPIIRIPNILDGFINYVALQFQVLPENEKRKLTLKKGDILFVRSNGNPDYIGRCGLFDDEKECIFASYLIRARLKKDARFNPLFVRYIFSMDSYKQKIRKESRTTAGNYNINTKGIKNFDLIKVPLALQERFVKLLNKNESLKQKMLMQSKELDNQFQALMQKSFKGQL